MNRIDTPQDEAYIIPYMECPCCGATTSQYGVCVGNCGEPFKVLIAAPISGHKQYSINEWFNFIANQEYKNYDFALCVNGKDQEQLVSMLKEVEITDVHSQTKKPIVLCNILKEGVETNILQNITHARETLRRYAEKNDYDYILFLDTDTIPIQLNAIEMLISTGKTAVSGVYFYKKSTVPVMVSCESKTNFTLKELEDAANNHRLLPTEIFGLGCALIYKSVFKKIPFSYSVFGKEIGDDYGYCFAMSEEGINRYTEPKLLCKHLGEAMINPIPIRK